MEGGEGEGEEREKKKRKMEGPRPEGSGVAKRPRMGVIRRERSEGMEEDEEIAEEEERMEPEVTEPQEPLRPLLRWLRYHTSVVVRAAEQADHRQRELYNVQVNINNNLVLLSRSVEKWMGFHTRVDMAETGERGLERVDRGVETEEVEQEEVEKGQEAEGTEMLGEGASAEKDAE